MPSLLRIVLGLLVVAMSLATAQIKMNVVTPVRRVRASLGTGKACADRVDTDRSQDPALVIFGRPLPILWDGGRRPFELSIVKADNLSHTVRLSAVVCNRLGAVLLTNTCVLQALLAPWPPLVLEHDLDGRPAARHIDQRSSRGSCPLARFDSIRPLLDVFMLSPGSRREDRVLGAASRPE
jgi:hypothetical protein